jgi:hypothetical protein
MNWQTWTVGRYAYKIDHFIRATLIVSVAINIGLSLLVWVLIGFLAVWK